MTTAQHDNSAIRPSPVRDDRPRLLIVDDHPGFRWVLRYLGEHRLHLKVCGEAHDCATALRFLRQMRPDLCTVDLSLSDGSGLELIKQGKAECPSMAFLVCSMHTETHYAERSLHAGAIGYVCKNEEIDQIVERMNQALSGEVAVSKDLAHSMLQGLTTGQSLGALGIEWLSDRELEIFEMLGQGMSRRHIAERVGRSVKTIETHCERIKEKLGIETSSELTSRAARWTLI
jgi:DNA-binding NarL/FixJ family response regulator